MRTRLSKNDRRTDILKKARKLIATRGYTRTEMEDIRLECKLSRGGLYHHFGNKRAVLDALIEEEVLALAKIFNDAKASPIAVLLDVGSSHLGNDPGIVADLNTKEEQLAYLSGLELSVERHLTKALAARLQALIRPDFEADHVAELFLTVNMHINRRQILGEWTDQQAASFAATALQALVVFLTDPTELQSAISGLKEAARP